MSVVKYQAGREVDEDMEEISRFLAQLEYNGAGGWSWRYTYF